MRSSERPIGVFDSGVGGLTVLRQVHRALPGENLIYLGDTARVPYGTKSPATVIRFACEDTAFLLRHDVKAIVVACNTVSAWALPTLQAQFEIPILGVILPGARAALARTRNRSIGVIGTSATIRSKAYEDSIRARDAAARITACACPLLVPLVEEGWTQHPVTREVLEVYLRPLRAAAIDTLVLGCTHYPLLKETIQAVVGPSVGLVDSAEECARDVGDQLDRLDLLRSGPGVEGAITLFVTDEVERFTAVSNRFLGEPVPPPTQIQLEGPLRAGGTD